MRLAIGSDERTYLTDKVIDFLTQQGHSLLCFGALNPTSGSTLWPDVGRTTAEAVVGEQADEGILFCWTGTGVSIAANKVPGIRAALCEDAETAAGARQWNNANIICLSLRRLSEARAEEILKAWFATAYQPNPQDETCLRQIEAIEQKYSEQK